jgi:hypothetical protein
MVLLYQVSCSHNLCVSCVSPFSQSFSLPIGALSAAVVIVWLRLPKKAKNSEPIVARLRELDMIGAGLFIPAIVCLLLALQWGGNKYAWNNSRIIGLFIGFGLLIIIFIGTQLKFGDQATIPPRILRQRTVAAASGFAAFFGGAIFALMYYLPIYFQSIRGATATSSGIRVLPLMLSTVLASMLSGGLVTAFGYYTPFLIGSTALFAIGMGLITTYTVDISTGKWIGYQVLAGLGVGAGFQIPMTSVQTVLSQEDIPVGSAIVVFFQSFGGALFISVGQSVFQNGLAKGVREFAPSVNPVTVLSTGATEIRRVLIQMGQGDQLPGIYQAYMVGLKDAYRVSLALTCVAFVAACCLEWRSVKGEKKEVAVPAA